MQYSKILIQAGVESDSRFPSSIMAVSNPTNTSLTELDEDRRLREAKDANQARFEEDLEVSKIMMN